jgi:hypothetical protein
VKILRLKSHFLFFGVKIAWTRIKDAKHPVCRRIWLRISARLKNLNIITSIKPRVKAALPKEGDGEWLMKEEAAFSEGKMANI